MISAIVFSKNRAAQLDLLLKSIKQNFVQCNEIRVIWKADDEHLESYEILMKEFCSKIIFIKQERFYQDTWEACKNSKNQNIVMFTDDDIVYRNIEISENILNELRNEIFACYSLRLGLNINKRQIDDKWYNDTIQDINSFGENDLIWNRTSVLPHSYWGYVLSVDGHIFNKQVLCKILYEIFLWSNINKYSQTPNKLEALMQRFFFEVGPFMLAPKYSCVVNSPNNRVQDDYKNRSGDQYSYCEDHLMQLYISGYRIGFYNLDFPNINCPHTEIKLL